MLVFEVVKLLSYLCLTYVLPHEPMVHECSKTIFSENKQNFENHPINYVILIPWLSTVFPRGKEEAM